MQNFPYLEQKNGGWVWNFPKSLNMATQVCDFWEIKSPEKICIKDFTDVDLPVLYSYKDLRKFSDSLAFELRNRGVGKGDRVGVLLLKR